MYIEATLTSAQGISRQHIILEDIVVGLGTDRKDGCASMIIKIGSATARGERLGVGIRHIHRRDIGVDLIFDLGMGPLRMSPLEWHWPNIIDHAAGVFRPNLFRSLPCTFIETPGE